MLTPFLILIALLIFGPLTMIQEQEPSKPETAAPAPALPSQTAIPASAANQPNPVHSTPESQARAKHIYSIDCAMCHAENGSGKGDVPAAPTIKMLDYRDPSSLKGLTDGQIFYIITNGRGDMPPEAGRAKPDEIWNLVIYLRSFSNAASNASSHGPS